MTRPPFPELIVMSREECEAFVAGVDDVCISIVSPGHPPAELSANFRAVLRVYFGDLPWDDCDDHEAQITPRVADEIVAFSLKHRDARRLAIHCQAGISRSTSTAQALSVHLGRRWWFPKWFKPEYRSERKVVNPNVFNAIAKAYGRAVPGTPVVTVPGRQPKRGGVL